MKKVFCFSLLLLSVSFLAHSQGQTTYLKAIAPPGELGGMIIGNSVAKGHEKEIEVLSYSHGIASCSPNALKGGGLGACKASLSDLSLMMVMSPGLNQLRYLTFTGKKLLSADLVMERNGADKPMAFYKIHLEDVTVTSVQESGSSETPIVSVSFSATRIAWAIYEQKEGGSLELVNKVGFNLGNNTVWNYSF